MKCVAETFSGAVGVCLAQGRRTGGDRRAWPARPDAGMRSRMRVPDRLCGDRRPADGVRPGKPFYRAAATKSDGRTAGTADRDALFGGDGQCRLGEQHQAGGSRARVRAGDQVSGRAGGEEGHAAVRDRAGALQGSAGAGPSSGGGRQGDARQCRSRIHAAAGTAGQGRLDPSQSRQGARPTETRRAPMCCKHRPIPRTRKSTLGYTTVSAPFDGVVTARKVSVGELVGGNQPSELATIVQINPIWVWFNLSERDVQRVRASMAERGVTVAELVNKVPVEVGLQTETGYPHKGLLDYTSPERQSVDRNAAGARLFREREGRAAAGLFRSRAGAVALGTWRCSFRRWLSAAIRRAATC